MMEAIISFWEGLPVVMQIMTKITFIVAPLMLAVAYVTYAERKIIGYMQVRLGPNRVGPKGWLQPIADALKLLTKEVIVPTNANRFLFLIAPVLSHRAGAGRLGRDPLRRRHGAGRHQCRPALYPGADLLGVYGVIIAGWASNSKYALLGAMRSAAQIVSYEIAMGFALVGVLMAAGSLNLGEIVRAQQRHAVAGWFWLPLLPLFVVYFISGVAETNRAPFDVAEGESEIVAGFHVEYSGMAFAVFFLAEYANMILIAALTACCSWGGWLSPFQGLVSESVAGGAGLVRLGDGYPLVPAQDRLLPVLFLWFRATFPRYRYDQIMRLGWKVLIPVTMVWLFVHRCDRGPGLAALVHGVRSMMNAVRNFVKSFLLWELLLGMRLTGACSPRKITVQYPRRRRRSRPASAACMPCAAIPTARSAALPASCARPSARRWPSPSSRSSARTAPGAPPVTTSTCSSASTAASARRPARWIPSSRRICSSTTSRIAASRS
jgi:NADH-quinone oxidoreductase subunit H